MQLWFVSDTHFGHANILTFESDGVLMRPGFKDVDEMDELMISRWNEMVKPQDHVYHLGDLCMMKRFISVGRKLNGHKRLILGNHDIYDVKLYREEGGFEKIFGSRVIADLLFTHIPVHPGSVGRFRANIHGHTHTYEYAPVLKIDKATQAVRTVPYINVCVEVTNYRPISLEEIQAKVDQA